MIWLIAVLFVIAPFFGSFAGVLVLRLPAGRPVLTGRSQCDHCGTVLHPLDLVPLASWLALRGRCRHCHVRLGYFFPLIELAFAGIVLWAATVTSGWLLVASCILGWVSLTLALIDCRTFLLPDPLTAALAIAGMIAAYFFDRVFLPEHLMAVLLGFAFFAAFAWTYKRLRGRDGLGLGDAKLLAAIGAWVSLQGLVSVVLYGAVIGLFTVLIKASLRKTEISAHTRAPFGAFLAMGGWLVWLYGPVLYR